MGRHFFPDHVKEDVAPRLAHELELLAQVLDRLLEPAVGPEVAAKAAVLFFQVLYLLGVLDDGLDLTPVPDDSFVFCEGVQIGLGEVGNGVDIEFTKGLS